MNINPRSVFHFGAMLAVLLLTNKFVLSFEERQQTTSCKATSRNACKILCRDWDLSSKFGAQELTKALKAEGEKFKSCTLILDHCTQTNATWVEEENLEENPKIEELKVLHSVIDFNDLSLQIFKNLKRLTIKNTTTTILRLESFRRLPKLEKLRVKKPNLLKSVEKGLLQNLLLNYLQIHGIILDRTKTLEFFKNLTDGGEISSIRSLDWSHNNFGNFTKDLLLHFPNLDVLILTDSGIINFEDDVFTNTSIKTLKINENEIKNLPEKTFRPLLEVASFVSLEGNNLTCDCEMKWLQTFIKTHKHLKTFKINCANSQGTEFLETHFCAEKIPESSEKESSAVHCTHAEHLELAHDYSSWSTTINPSRKLNDSLKKFTVRNTEANLVEIALPNTAVTENAFLWYGSYANSTWPQFSCLKVLQQKFTIQLTPETNYLICLATDNKHFKIDIFDCLPFKTSPLHENQPWLTKKSISVSIITIFFVSLFSLVLGALILYLLVRKNPTLIRGSKRVIKVKRHDKAQILIMPRGYENLSQTEALSLLQPHPSLPLEPSRLSLSCDTISTVSYVSANQPTQLEIFTYRLHRLRELFQRNHNLPPPVSSLPIQIAIPSNQRLPPDVDLLFEYEWYTIMTMTTTNL